MSPSGVAVFVCLSAGWGLWGIFAKELLVDCCLIRLVVSADAGPAASAHVGFNLIALGISIGCGLATAAVKLLVGLVIIGLIMGVNARLARASVLLHTVSLLVDRGGNVRLSGG